MSYNELDVRNVVLALGECFMLNADENATVKKGVPIIHFSEILGEQKLRITDIMRRSEVGRLSMKKLYDERLDDLDKMKFGTLIKLCDALGVSLNELIEYYPPKKYNEETKQLEDY